MEEHISTGFLYALGKNRLIIKEGNVVRNRWCSKHEAVFRYSNHNGDWTACHSEPEKVVHAKLWLPERNDSLGRKLLMEYYETCIEDLRNRITAHEAKIKFLKDA